MMISTIGMRIRMQRKKVDMTLVEVAKEVGVSAQTIQRYEVGDIENIPSDKIEKLALTLQTTPAYLMGWTDRPENKVSKSSELDEQLKDIIYACAGGDKPLTDEQKQDIIDTYRFVQSKKKKE